MRPIPADPIRANPPHPTNPCSIPQSVPDPVQPIDARNSLATRLLSGAEALSL